MAEPTLKEKIEGTQEILSELEAKCHAKNQEMAADLRQHRADIEAALGDARLESERLAGEIQRLTTERDAIQGSITASQAALDAQKVDLAQREQRLREGQENISKDMEDVVAKIHDVGQRELRLATDREALAASLVTLEKNRADVLYLSDLAATDRMESANKLEQTKLILEDAKKQKATAEDAANKILAEANARLAEAEEVKAKADQAFQTAQNSIASADAKAAEYNKLLTESRAFAQTNSETAGRLEIWEASLRAAHDDIEDRKGKLAVAEKEFVKKTKGEK